MEERRTNKHRLGLALSIRRKKFWLFFGILWLSWLCTRTKFPPSYQECWLILLHWLTWLQGPQVPTHHFSSRFSLTIAFPWLSLTPICWLLWDLVFFQFHRKSRAQSLCMSFVPKQTKESSDWRSPPYTLRMNTHHCATKCKNELTMNMIL